MPFFKDVAVGCYVRVGIGAHEGSMVYRVSGLMYTHTHTHTHTHTLCTFIMGFRCVKSPMSLRHLKYTHLVPQKPTNVLS